MSATFKVAVVGATGLVGREMIKVLEERQFPVSDLVLLASSHSAGEKIEFQNTNILVHEATSEALDNAQIVLMSAGANASAELAPIFAKNRAVVIDNSSQWRLCEDVPLVVPEVNANDIAGYTRRKIIANPNCATIQLVVALAPLHARASLKRVVVSTYQAVSGKGKHAVDELGKQVAGLLQNQDPEPSVFTKRIAFNCIPHIDVFTEHGHTKEEDKMLYETRKILHAQNIGVCATCVRVPVFHGHAESVVAEFESPLGEEEAKEILKQAPGVYLMDNVDSMEKDMYPTPRDVVGSDATFVGRLRKDRSVPNSLAFWCVADNLRKGAASNAVQIAEILAKTYL